MELATAIPSVFGCKIKKKMFLQYDTDVTKR